MSERGLYKAFKVHMNTTVAEELVQNRLRHAKRLLLESDKRMIEIADESGFGDYRNLFYTFQRNYGVGPKAWREDNR
jgi:transcriptional regulator GlxA family with amidase domain